MCQNMALSTNTLAYNMQKNMIGTVGETEEHLLHHLLFGGAFAHCTNCLVNLTAGKLNALPTVVRKSSK
jgi:hypothetical protein